MLSRLKAELQQRLCAALVALSVSERHITAFISVNPLAFLISCLLVREGQGGWSLHITTSSE